MPPGATDAAASAAVPPVATAAAATAEGVGELMIRKSVRATLSGME